MLGTPATAPGMGLVVALLVALGVLFLIGAWQAGAWPAGMGRAVRYGAVALAVLVPLGWHLAFPTSSGIEGAGRLVVVLPLVVLDLVLAAIWAFRARTGVSPGPASAGRGSVR